MILVQKTSNIKMVGIYNAIKNFEETQLFDNLSQVYSMAKSFGPKKIILFIEDEKDLNKLNNTISAVKSEDQNIDIRIFGTINLDQEKYTNLNKIGYLTDINLYGNGKKSKYYEADVVLFSDDINEKNMHHHLVIKYLSSNYRLKIFGSKSISFIEYLGGVEESSYKNIFASAKYLIIFNMLYYINQSAINGCLPIVSGIDFTSIEELKLFMEKDNSELQEKLKFDAATNSYLRYVKDNIL